MDVTRYRLISDDFREITIRDHSFYRCNFHGSTFSKVRFINCTFDGCFYSSMKFEKCILKNCNFVITNETFTDTLEFIKSPLLDIKISSTSLEYYYRKCFAPYDRLKCLSLVDCPNVHISFESITRASVDSILLGKSDVAEMSLVNFNVGSISEGNYIGHLSCKNSTIDDMEDLTSNIYTSYKDKEVH